MTETFFVGNNFFPFNHYELYQEHPATYELIARIWGSKIKPPAQDDSRAPGILDLRITATLMSQRGDFKGALQLIAEAEERDPDTEGRIANLRKSIEELRDKSNAAGKSSAVEPDGPAPATENQPNP